MKGSKHCPAWIYKGTESYNCQRPRGHKGRHRDIGLASNNLRWWFAWTNRTEPDGRPALQNQMHLTPGKQLGKKVDDDKDKKQNYVCPNCGEHHKYSQKDAPPKNVSIYPTGKCPSCSEEIDDE